MRSGAATFRAGAWLTFSIVCEPGLAYGVTAVMTCILSRFCDEQGQQRRNQEYALLLVLRQEPARGAQAHRRPDRIHLRRVRRAVHGHRWRGEQVLVGEVARRHSEPEGDTQSS